MPEWIIDVGWRCDVCRINKSMSMAAKRRLCLNMYICGSPKASLGASVGQSVWLVVWQISSFSRPHTCHGMFHLLRSNERTSFAGVNDTERKMAAHREPQQDSQSIHFAP